MTTAELRKAVKAACSEARKNPGQCFWVDESVPAVVWCTRTYHRGRTGPAWTTNYYIKHEAEKFQAGGYGDIASMVAWAVPWLEDDGRRNQDELDGIAEEDRHDLELAAANRYEPEDF